MRLPCLCVYRNMDVIIRGRAGEVRFEGFGRLRGQNGPPDRARSAGEQSKSGSWGAVRFGGFGPLSGQNGVPERERSTEAQPQEKGGHKTKEQPGKPALRRISAALLPRRATRNSKEHRQANQDWESWEVRFEGFGPLSGQNGQPERARSTAKQMKSRRARKVRFDGLGQLSGQNGAPDGERSTEAEPREKGAEQLGKPALGKPQKRKVDVTRPNTRHTRRPSMAQSATPATQNPTSRHNRGTASQLRKRVRVTDEEDLRVTDEGLSL
jgi:hypothetical protein